MYDTSKLAANIGTYRDRRGWTQEELAIKMQLRGHKTITQPRQAEIEQGRRDVSAAELVSYARIFGIRITELLGVPDLAEE